MGGREKKAGEEGGGEREKDRQTDRQTETEMREAPVCAYVCVCGVTINPLLALTMAYAPERKEQVY